MAFMTDVQPIVAVLDACVLFPAALRDTLLRTAQRGLYRVCWSAEILEEVHRNLVKERLTGEQAHKLLNAMRTAFPGALIREYESLIVSMPNDPKDRHVLAAAVKAQAQIIVTYNLKDFPAAALAPLNVQPQSPDVFLTHLLDLYPEVIKEVVLAQAQILYKPPQTPQDVLNKLVLHAPTFAARVRAALGT
jgi:predicted nucleic acid-binding protein